MPKKTKTINPLSEKTIILRTDSLIEIRLLTKEYNINFLFVLASYVKSNSDKSLKNKIRKRFKEDMIKLYDSRYHFGLLKRRVAIMTQTFS